MILISLLKDACDIKISVIEYILWHKTLELHIRFGVAYNKMR